MFYGSHTTQAVISLSSGESEFSRNCISFDVQRFQDLHKQNHQARSQEDSAHCNSKIVGAQAHIHNTAKPKSRKSVEPRTRKISETNRRVLERCHCFAREGRSGVALRAEVQEITKPHPEVCTFDDAGELDTQSEPAGHGTWKKAERQCWN